MLSILIPIYNIDCRDLVGRLYSQCMDLDISFEIICMDDASEFPFKTLNRQLESLENVRYTELAENTGRAQIRNKLAAEARFEFIAFLDADSTIIRDDFIGKYVSYSKNNCVLYGGTVYPASKPADKELILHWKYARKYEALSFEKRVNNPFLTFMSNNFMIRKQIFEKLRFDTAHKGYGYEDTLFALQLEKMGVKICHIDNPVLHSGLVPAGIFLGRTIEAMQNLALYYISGKLNTTRLAVFYYRLYRLGIDGLVARFIAGILPLISKNLQSDNPCVSFFQIYKYYYFYKYVNSSD